MNGAAVVGCHYQKGGQTFREYGPVSFASGGHGADFGNNSLLAKYRPDLLHLLTTNGEHCTGDAIKTGEDSYFIAGDHASTVDVQVYVILWVFDGARKKEGKRAMNAAIP